MLSELSTLIGKKFIHAILFPAILLVVTSCSNGALDLDIVKFSKTINAKKIKEIMEYNHKNSPTEEEYHTNAAKELGSKVPKLDFKNVGVVSVSKDLESKFKAAASIYILTSDDIRRSGATSIP